MDGEVRLEFRIRNVGHHAATWEQMGALVDEALDVRTVKDIRQLVRLRCIIRGANGWVPPSTVRNTWNYADPRLYGDHGDLKARVFSKLVSSDDSAFGWALSRKYPTEGEQVAAVAYVGAFLSRASESIAPSILT